MKHESISHLTRQQQRDRAILDKMRLSDGAARARSLARIEAAKQRRRDLRETISQMDFLTASARAHIEAGGCGGDLCRNCNGTGDEVPGWRTGGVNDICHACDGRGMR